MHMCRNGMCHFQRIIGDDALAAPHADITRIDVITGASVNFSIIGQTAQYIEGVFTGSGCISM